MLACLRGEEEARRRLELRGVAGLPAATHLRSMPHCSLHPPPAVMAKLKKGGAVTQALFKAAFAYKLFLLRRGVPHRCARSLALSAALLWLCFFVCAGS